MDWRRFWEQLPPVTRNILAINLVVGLADFVFDHTFHFNIVEWLGLFNWGYSAFHGAQSFHIWQPFTYMFLHSGVSHWFCNMFAVLIFGPIIEQEWGSKKYLIYYLVCGVGAALVQEVVWMLSSGAYPAVTIGASGAVFGILFAFAWLFPEQKMFLLFIPIPIPARWFVGLYAFFELTAGVVSLSDGIAHFAHLGGLLFGYLLIKYWQYQSNHRNRFKDYEGRDFSGYHYKAPLK